MRQLRYARGDLKFKSSRLVETQLWSNESQKSKLIENNAEESSRCCDFRSQAIRANLDLRISLWPKSATRFFTSFFFAMRVK